MSNLIRLKNAALSDSELLDQILAELPAPPDGLHATRAERAERYARLARDCDARRARLAFKVVS